MTKALVIWELCSSLFILCDPDCQGCVKDLQAMYLKGYMQIPYA